MPYRLAIPQYWCRVWDLNPYAKRRRILNPVCLPIPPTRQMVTHGGIEPTDPGLKARWLNLLANAPCGAGEGNCTLDRGKEVNPRPRPIIAPAYRKAGIILPRLQDHCFWVHSQRLRHIHQRLLAFPSEAVPIPSSHRLSTGAVQQ